MVVSDDLPCASTSCAMVPPSGRCILMMTYVVQSTDFGSTVTNVGTVDSDHTVAGPMAVEKVLTSNANQYSSDG